MTFGNAKVEATQGGLGVKNVQDNNNGTYALRSDSYKGSQPLGVKINGTAMKGSPYNTLPQVDPHQCTIQLGLPGGRLSKESCASGYRRMENMIAKVQTVDIDGKRMTIGNAKVEATQDGDSLTHSLHVQDNHDGTYTIDYNPHGAGGSQPIHVKINGTEMKGSPYNTLPEVDPHQCTIQLGLPGGRYDVDGYRKKENMTAKVQTVDTNGQKMTIGNAKVEATQALHVKDNHDGTYTIDCKCKPHGAEGSQPIHVKINGTEMEGSPFNAPQVDPHQCTIRLNMKSKGYGCKKAVVQAVDANGQKMTIGNAKVEATQDGDSLDVQDKHDGTYTIDYTYGYGHFR
ncbi:gelation factor-like [Amphiura filiformis]|uniref:gelation factor-like n=1 Tax=Amphiura filiformis TaxID=82378 RepID=UPI003B21B482